MLLWLLLLLEAFSARACEAEKLLCVRLGMNRSLYSSDVFTEEFKDEEGEEKLVPES